MIGGKLLNHVACTIMANKAKKLLQPNIEDVKLAEKIKKLYETHDVKIVRNVRGWSVSVKRKDQ